jgi:MoaA/NifB/PqqE/SkfB family radical SAM enzyme
MKAELEALLDTQRLVNKEAKLNAARSIIEGALRLPQPKSLPVAVDIILTKACNLRCIMCVAYGSLRDERWMPFERYELIARELFPTAQGVFFCSGGEPFLYPKIRDALALARKHRTITYVSSNGMLIDEAVSEWLVADQSLQELTVSFDGATKGSLERIRVGANYDRILANLKRLSQAKKRDRVRFPRVSMRYAIARYNADEFPRLVEVAADRGVYKIDVVYVNFPDEIDFSESLFNHRELTARVFAEARAQAHKRRVELRLPPLPGKRGRRRNCVYPWRFIQIDSDGSIRFCYHTWRQRLGFVEDGLRSIWFGEHYRRIRETIDSESPYYPYCRFCFERLGFGDESSHRVDLDSELYGVPGLESLAVPFDSRLQVNKTAFKEAIAAAAAPRSAQSGQ